MKNQNGTFLFTFHLLFIYFLFTFYLLFIYFSFTFYLLFIYFLSSNQTHYLFNFKIKPKQTAIYSIKSSKIFSKFKNKVSPTALCGNTHGVYLKITNSRFPPWARGPPKAPGSIASVGPIGLRPAMVTIRRKT